MVTRQVLDMCNHKKIQLWLIVLLYQPPFFLYIISVILWSNYLCSKLYHAIMDSGLAHSWQLSSTYDLNFGAEAAGSLVLPTCMCDDAKRERPART